MHLLTDFPPNSETSTTEGISAWQKADRKARPHIVLNSGEESSTLFTSLLLQDIRKKQFGNVYVMFTRRKTSKYSSIIDQNCTIRLSEDGDIIEDMTNLEQIFVDFSRINDPFLKTENSGHLLRSLPSSLSFLAIVGQANNMTYTDLCSLLTAQSERRKQNAQPVPDTPPPVIPPARVTTNEHEHRKYESRVSDIYNVICWYCGKGGPIKGQCR